MIRFKDISLKNKFFYSSLFVILLISAAIALLARWILVSSLSNELTQRGIAIAQSVAERASPYMLDNRTPELVSLIFDAAWVGERKALISYIYIQDTGNHITAHTFTRPFPEDLRGTNDLQASKPSSVRELAFDSGTAIDIAVPIMEGIYRIGSVHVGLNKAHIDSLIGKLRITFLGFISAVIVIIFLISNWISRYITMPISRLTRISDELCRGNFDIGMDFGDSEFNFAPQSCPAYIDTGLPCRHYDQSAPLEQSAESQRLCAKCSFYRKTAGDEVAQLADSFRNMVWSIKLYRRRLRESEEKYRSLFHVGPDPVFVVDCRARTILDANPRVTDIYGFAPSELADRSFDELAPGFLDECLNAFDTPDNPDNCCRNPRALHYKKDGTPFYVNAHACPISYKGRQSVVVAATDITEMMEKDAQLIQAGKMKTLGEMSAGIAHELNQPLNAIKMGGDFLSMVVGRGMGLSREHLTQVVTEISTQVDRATEIINTLREFGRKSDLLPESLNLNEPVQAVLRIIGRQLTVQNVRMRLELTEGLPRVRAHSNRVQQVIFNLVANARDAVLERYSRNGESEDGEVVLRTFAEGGRVCLCVADNGIGIAEDAQSKIFEPFYTTKETGQGMGLGLAISYGIVKDYGGDIAVSGRPGEGTLLTLSFPVAQSGSDTEKP